MGLCVKVIGIWKDEKEFRIKSFNIILAGILLVMAIPAGVMLSDEVEKFVETLTESLAVSLEAALLLVRCFCGFAYCFVETTLLHK